MEKYKCKICKKRICYNSAHSGSRMCRSCCRRGSERTQVTRDKISKALEGKKQSKATIEKRIQSNTGQKRTKATCEKISKANRGKNNGMFGKKQSKIACVKISKALKITLNKPEVKEKISGKNSHNYIHGLSKLPYSPEFTPSLKKSIIERDNYECQCCGMTQEEHLNKYNRSLEIHHIDHCPDNCEETNLITLCKKCNNQANYNIDYWYAYFTYKMEEILCY